MGWSRARALRVPYWDPLAGGGVGLGVENARFAAPLRPHARTRLFLPEYLTRVTENVGWASRVARRSRWSVR